MEICFFVILGNLFSRCHDISPGVIIEACHVLSIRRSKALKGYMGLGTGLGKLVQRQLFKGMKGFHLFQEYFIMLFKFKCKANGVSP